MAIHFHAYCEGMAALEIRHGVSMNNSTMEPLWVDGLTAVLHGFQTSTTPNTILAAVAATLGPRLADCGGGLQAGFRPRHENRNNVR